MRVLLLSVLAMAASCVPSRQSDLLIYSGELIDASDERFGATVALSLYFPESQKTLPEPFRSRSHYICSGVLVSPIHVVSAAHCFEGRMPRPDRDLVWLVSSGSTSMGGTAVLSHNVARFVRNVKRVTVRDPSFAYTNSVFSVPLHDVALLELEEDVPVAINTAKLVDETFELKEGLSLVIAGHGPDPKASLAADKIYPMLRIGRTSIQTVNPSSIPFGFLARPNQPNDACGGDSGGPAFSAERPHLVVGVISGGPPCSEGTRGIYTDLRHYLPWIKQQMSQAERP